MLEKRTPLIVASTMTMNNSNNVPSTEGGAFATTSLNAGVMLPVPLQHRTVRPPLMSKGLALLSHTINRKPVRRALTELGRNDRKHNARLANRLLTISTEEFKQKWNFDPIKMKPITEGSRDVVNSDGVQKKYQWELVKQNKAQEQDFKDKEELERTVFSLVSSHADRKQLRLSTIAVQLSSSSAPDSNTSQETSSAMSRIPQLKQDESTVSSTTKDESNTISTETKSITATNNSSNNSQQQPESITVASSEQQEIRERLTANHSSTAAAPVDAAVPTVTCAALTNITLSSRQSKITDFASHRKIVHGPAIKEESDLQPPSKRPRLTC